MKKCLMYNFSKYTFNGLAIKEKVANVKSVLFIVFLVHNLVFTVNIQAQNIFSYSYQNVSKNNGGGTLEKGDTIEIRALIKVEITTPNLYFIDTIRPGTKYIDNSLKVITNEGLTFRGHFTNSDNDDQGVYDITGMLPRLRINLGVGAQYARAGTANNRFGNLSGGGTVTPNEKPKFYGKTLFVVAYRLVITANFGDIIYLTGNYYYDSVKNGTHKQNHRFNYSGIKVNQNQALCTNYSSASFSAESNFGSGNIQNRLAGAIVPGYNKVSLNANDPGDGNYAIANNTSANGTTNNSGPYKPNPARVFGVWDIIGDHSNSPDPALGNTPPVSGSEGGYMLVVNAAFTTGEAYRDKIKNVCPNTYYEFSAWVRNICGKCSLDSNGISPNTPGVQPNLAFTVNDVDYYTTGNIPYTEEWVKRGFIYKTGPTETEFTITIKNNAPGGGGNDWVLDDIKLATCYPDLIMNPGDTAKLCANFLVHLSDTVKSFFPNYTNYCWQKSSDGINWSNTSNCGTAIPVFKNGLWEYVVDTVFTVVAADSGKQFRVKVATTAANLVEDKCAVDNSQKVFLQVYSINCKALEERFLNFSGKVLNNYVTLKWLNKNKHASETYEVERSSDGINFKKVGVVLTSEKFIEAEYKFIDPERISSGAFYRLIQISAKGNSRLYSKTIYLLNDRASFSLITSNPFVGAIRMEIYLPENGEVEFQISNLFGKKMLKEVVLFKKGNSTHLLKESGNLPAGWYLLRTIYNNTVIQSKLLKVN